MTAGEIRLFREAAQVLLTLLRCISMKRAIAVAEGDHLNFFRVYDGCLMDTIALSWCKLFGSPKEDLNWEKLFPETATAVRPRLAKQLLQAVTDLEALSMDLRKYRDTYVAHHDLDETKRATKHPELEPLRATGWIVYAEVFKALKQVRKAHGLAEPDTIDASDLDGIEEHWRMIASQARKATNGFADCPTDKPKRERRY